MGDDNMTVANERIHFMQSETPMEGSCGTATR